MLSEKPAGVHTKQVRELNHVAEASDRVFAIMLNQRTHARHQAMRDLVQSGELGPIIRTQYTVTHWIRTQAYYHRGGWRGM